MAKPKNFAIPLQKKGGQTHAPNGTFDYKEIGRIYRERLGGNPFGIKPDLKPYTKCSYCTRVWDPNTGMVVSGDCSGTCVVG